MSLPILPDLPSPDLVVRRVVLDALRKSGTLMALVNRVEDGTPVQASPPYVVLGESLSADWSTKSAEGREVMLGLTFYARSGDSIRVAAAIRAAEQALALLPAQADGWQLVSARTTRARIAGSAEIMKGSGWSGMLDVRVRMMGATPNLLP